MKKTKLIMSIIACCFALSVLAFVVYASLSVNFNLSGKITFDPNGVDAHIETQVFKYNQEITHDDAYLLASDVQAYTIGDFNGDTDYTAIEENHVSYDTKNGNVYEVEHTMSDLQFDFEDCNAYVIVIHVNPNNTNYDLEEHNQIVFGELKTSTEFPDGAWLAYNDKYLVIYPSAQEDGLNMVLVVGVEQFKEVAETDFTLTLTLSYKDIYQLGENDTIEEPLWDNAGPDDIYIYMPSYDEEDNLIYFDEIVLPETIEYENTTKNVVGIRNTSGEIYGKKLILNKNCASINVRDENDEFIGFEWYNQAIKDYIIVDQRNEKISSLDNMLFSKDKSLLMVASDSYTSYTIPSFVKKIIQYAFDYCGNLEEVKISEGVKIIEESVFFDCSSLTSITIPDSVTNIGYGTFFLTNLSSIYIPTSVQTMGEGIFEDIKNSNFKIYCGATQQPDGWDSGWNDKDIYNNKWTDITWGITRERYNEIVNG